MKSEQRRICIRDQLIKAIQGRTVPAAVADKFLERIHPSGNWHDSGPPWGGAEGGNPRLRVPSGPRGPASQIHLCAARPRCSGSLCSSSPTGLLAVPRTRPLSPPPGFGSRHLFPSGMSFLPSVQIISLQGPCPHASSTRKPPGGGGFCKRLSPASHPASPSPASRAVTARVCPGSSPRPGCACRKGGAVGTGTVCGFSLPRLPRGGGRGAVPGGAARASCLRQTLSPFLGRVDSHTDQPSPLRPLAASSVARPLYFLSARGGLAVSRQRQERAEARP